MHRTNASLRRCLPAVFGLLAGGVLSQAQPAFTAHYPAGVEGIKAATLPPPGFYVRDYNYIYWSERYRQGPPGFETTVYVNAPRAIWMTDFKILGATYGLDLLVPFIYQSASAPAAGLDVNFFDLYDIHFEPLLLAWHGDQYDIGAGYAFWAPTGRSGTAPRPYPGKGFWGHMFTLGATVYPDKEKTWSVSVLNRYEINMESRDFNITPGNAHTLEFGIAKSITKTIDVGVAGYWQQQVTSDDGTGASKAHDRIFGVGPEISAFCPKLGVFVAARYAREFGAQDRPEGNTINITLTKRF